MNLITQIRDARGLGAAEKAILFALASRCARGKFAAWPSVPRLAEDAGLSVRSTQRVCRKLEEIGWLNVQLKRSGNRNAPSTYTINPVTGVVS